MIEDKALGVKIAEDTDEAFWTDTKDKCKKAIEAESRNIKINQVLINLCEQELLSNA